MARRARKRAHGGAAARLATLPFCGTSGGSGAGGGTLVIDGRLVGFTATASVAGWVAAFLLGNLRDTRLGRVGLAVVIGGAALVIYNDPSHSPGELVFLPVSFVIGWLAGFAPRQRATQAEEAEERAARAERERAAAARIAVAEERARIARELHDVVAHAVSVMVLQVGAVRHRLPPSLAEDKDALTDVEKAGRAALAEMRRLLGAMHDGEDAERAPHPGLDNLDALVERVGPGSQYGSRWRATPSRSRAPWICRPIESCRRA
jgi:signal transduction histidine kinase